MEFLNDVSVKAEEIIVSPATVVGHQYSLVRQIQKHLNYSDLSACCAVSQLWLAAAQAGVRDGRRRAGAWFGWKSRATPQLHKHYELCGNNLLSYHVEAGVLKDIQAWLKNLEHRPHMVLAVGTGVAYIYYLITKNAHFILQEEVDAFTKLHNLLPPNCSSLFLTSLRVTNPSLREVSTLDMSMISVPKPTTNCEIKPFIVSDNELLEAQADIWKSNPLLSFEEVNIRIFEHVTNVPVDLIKGLVVFNTGDFTTIVRSVLDNVGSFPLCLAESEGLTCMANKNHNKETMVIPSTFSNYSSHTSGLVMLGQDIQVSSVLLDTTAVSETSIKTKLKELDTEKKLKTSLGIMLTTCMRGYDGVDISREHVELRNNLQQVEASVFKEMFPQTELVAVQVEDVLGLSISSKDRGMGSTRERPPRWEENKENILAENKLLDEREELGLGFSFSDSSTVFVKIDY